MGFITVCFFPEVAKSYSFTITSVKPKSAVKAYPRRLSAVYRASGFNILSRPRIVIGRDEDTIIGIREDYISGQILSFFGLNPSSEEVIKVRE